MNRVKINSAKFIRRIGVFSSLVLGWGAASISHAAMAPGPCAQITAACRNAGFVQGAAKAGNGLQLDCIAPIMQGTAQAHKGSNPLPQVDQQVVAACKSRNPSFGQRGASPTTADTPPALVEHRGPNRDPTDPDLPAARSGNPTTYDAIRGLKFIYVEYADGEKEYHDLSADPNELHNSFFSLSNEEKAALHGTLEAVKNCHSAKSCHAAERPARTVAQR